MGADGFPLPANQCGPRVQGAEQKVSGLCSVSGRNQVLTAAGKREGNANGHWARTRAPAIPLAVPGSLDLGAVTICLPLQRHAS